jgi:hypothetical protein
MKSCLQTALLLNSLGMVPVLIYENQKRPIGNAWQDQRYTDDELRERFTNNENLNIGALLGPESGVIDIECDEPESPADLSELFDGEIPVTPSWSARRGCHYLFAYDERLAVLGKAVVKWKSVEIRLGTGKKAAQSLLPPSTTDGFTRQWTTELSPDCLPAKLPEVVIERLLASVESESQQAASQVRSIPKVDDDFCRRSDWKFLEDYGWKVAGDHATRPGKQDGASASFCTAGDGTRLLHVFSTNAGPFKPGKNYNAFNAYALLSHNGNAEAARTDLAKQGYGQIRIELITSKELAANDYTLEYHIPNVLVRGQPCIFAGAKKTLKTSLAIDLAISLASGEPFLGRFSVHKPCNTIMLSGESGLATIKETAHRICQSKGIELAGIDKLWWSSFLPSLDDAAHLNAVERMIEETQCEVLFVDPLYLCLSGVDAGNVFIQGGKLRPIGDACQRHGVTLLMVHHTRKQAKTQSRTNCPPPELDDIAWAGFAEFARQWLLVGRREEYVPGTGEHRLWANVGGSAGHSGLWALDVEEGIAGMPRHWNVILSSPNEAREEKKADGIRQRILDAMKEFPNGQTKTGIYTVANLRSCEKANAVFTSLIEEGQIVERRVKKGAATYTGYALAV